jgi:hypothetical protein
MGSPTRINYGDDLTVPKRQPQGAFSIDAYGLAQAQLTYAVDTDSLYSWLDFYKQGTFYPDEVGFKMVSYKYSVQIGKGSVSMITIDYMGISRAVGYTDTQIVGVSTTSAQAIEGHPNFTKVLDPLIGDGSDTQVLAGPPAQPSTNWNNPLWIKDPNDPTVFKFNGFGLMNDGDPESADNVNPKAGIRQYLKPMLNVRGTIFFEENVGPNIIANSVGKTILESAKERMLGQTGVFGAVNADMCLLTSANVEVIGTPTNPAGYKVTYDIMITDAKDSSGSSVGWDYDIYGEMDVTPF